MRTRSKAKDHKPRKRDFVTDDGFLIDSTWENLCRVEISQDRWERSVAEGNRRDTGEANSPGPGSLVPVGKIARRTFAYINPIQGAILSFRAERVLFTNLFETGIEGRNTVAGLYLSFNGNRIPTCYFLWEDFLGSRSFGVRTRESLRDYVEGFTRFRRGACEGGSCVSSFKENRTIFR